MKIQYIVVDGIVAYHIYGKKNNKVEGDDFMSQHSREEVKELVRRKKYTLN